MRFLTLLALCLIFAGSAHAWPRHGQGPNINIAASSGWGGGTSLGPDGATCNVAPSNLCPDLAAVGNPAAYGYDATVISRFSDAPFQTTTGTFDLYVVAFHPPSATEAAAGISNNIDYVTCSSGGAWTSTTVLSVIPGYTGPGSSALYGYKLRVRASDFTDGAYEIRCAAVPTTGAPIILQGGTTDNPIATNPGSLFINTNASGTLPGPTKTYSGVTRLLTYVSTTGTDTGDCTSFAASCATFAYAQNRMTNATGGDIGGGVICTDVGSYALDMSGTIKATATQYVTIQPASLAPCVGGSAGTVAIASLAATSRISFNKLQLYHIQQGDGAVTSGTGGSPPAQPCSVSAPCSTNEIEPRSISTSTTPTLWLNGGAYIGSGQFHTANQPYFAGAWAGGVYMTDFEISQTFFACTSVRLCKGVYIHDIASDGVQNPTMVLGTSLWRLTSCCAAHPDTFQLTGTAGVTAFNNIIVYGYNADTRTNGDIDAQGPFGDVNALSYNNIAIVNSVFDNFPAVRRVFFYQKDVTNMMLLGDTFIGQTTSPLISFDSGITIHNITVQNTSCFHTIGVSGVTGSITKYNSSSC